MTGLYHVTGTFIATAHHECPDCNGHHQRFIVNKQVIAENEEHALILASTDAAKDWEYVYDWDTIGTEWTIKNVKGPLPPDQVMRFVGAPELPLKEPV
jgi:hypothetical protein